MDAKSSGPGKKDLAESYETPKFSCLVIKTVASWEIAKLTGCCHAIIVKQWGKFIAQGHIPVLSVMSR